MKISIIGAGKVGSAIAFALLGSVRSIELVDKDMKRAEAECLDLQDAARVAGHKTEVSWSCRPGRADIYVICAGKPRKDGDNRSDLLTHNRSLVGEICGSISLCSTDPWIIVVTNPSGEMAKVCLGTFRKVIPCGRGLDNARSKIIGPHEEPGNVMAARNLAIRQGKGYTCWGVAEEVRGLVGEVGHEPQT